MPFKPKFVPLAETRGHGKHYITIDKHRRLMFLKRAQEEFGLAAGAVFQASIDRDPATGAVYLGVRVLGTDRQASSSTERTVDKRNYSLAISIHDKLTAYGVSGLPARFGRDADVAKFDDAGEGVFYFRLIS